MRGLLRASAIASVGLALSLAAGCGVERRTQVMLEIDAECGVRAVVDSLRVSIVSDDRTQDFDFPVAAGGDGWPRRIALIPAGGDAARRYEVRIAGRSGAAAVITTMVRAGYESQRTLGLRVVLTDACLGNTCGAGDQACTGGGACADPERSGLPEWSEGAPACTGAVPDAGPIDAARPDAAGSLDAGVDAGRDAGMRDAGPADAGPGEPILEIDFCRELVEVLCEGRMRCCLSATDTVAECRMRNQLRCGDLARVVGADDRIVYDPVVGRAVVEEVRALEMSCDTGLFDAMLTPEGIYRAWEGMLMRDANCGTLLGDVVDSLACVGDRSCRRSGMGVLRRRRCADRVGETGPCRGHLDCETGLYCTGFDLDTDGTCVAGQAAGASCTEAAQCASLICDTTTTSTCLARERELVYCADPFGVM